MTVKRKTDEIRRKITKSTISKIKPTDNSKWDEYLNTYSLQMFPASDQFKERLGVEMLEWARTNEDALIIEEYFDIRGICVDDVYRWIPACEVLAKAYEAAKRIIGYRREKGALKSDLNASTVHITMPHYSKVWRETEKWRSELKKENEQHGNIKVMIETYPSSPIVPDKKKVE
jgi:hypothetical protein